MNNGNKDRPRSLKDPEVREERKRLLQQTERVARLKELVKAMRDATGYGENIPHFDPMDGGVEARCLFLFEAAGGEAVESGFVSHNNDDPSAHKFFCINNDENFDRRLTVSWNIVPWALREDGRTRGRNRKPKADEIQKGLGHLEKLLELLEDLEVVVLCGASAQKATQYLYVNHPALCVLHAPHPSPQSMIQAGKEDHLRAAISKASQKC